MTTAADILKIPDDKPELLFTADQELEVQFRALMKEWHPDVSSDPLSHEVSSKITALMRRAKTSGLRRVVKSGEKTLVLSGTDGVTRRVKYEMECPFELGTMYYGDRKVVYVVRPEYSKLFDSAVTKLSTLHFASERMAREVGAYLPKVKSFFKTRADEGVLVLDKPEGVYTMRHVLEARGGTMAPEHAAWMMSSTLNLCCYLQWARISHGDLSLDSVFVSPKQHAVYLLGGWWYSAEFGDHLTHLPARTARLAPSDIIGEKVADSRTDLILARALIREMVGSPSVGELVRSGAGLPQPMANFLAVPGAGLALEDYASWTEQVLPSSFGARRFVELDITDSDIFKEK